MKYRLWAAGKDKNVDEGACGFVLWNCVVVRNLK